MTGAPTPGPSDEPGRSVRTSLATLLYAGFLAYQTLADGSGWVCDERVLRVGGHLSRTDMLANVVAYVPLGFLFILAALRPASQPAGRIAAVMLTGTALGGVLSALLETVQACLPARVSSMYDLAGNIVGTLLGAAIAVAVRSFATSWRETATPVHVRRPLRMLTLAIVFMWVALQTTPWVFTMDVSTIKSNLEALRPLLDGVSLTWPLVRHASAWVAVGCAWRLALPGILQPAVAVAATAAVTIALQVFLQSASPLSLPELAGASVGLILVIVSMVLAGHRPGTARWARALMLSAATTVAVYELLPGPDPAAALLGFSWWPLVGLGGMLGAIDYAILFAWFGVTAAVAQVWATPTTQAPSIAGWPLAAVLLTFVLEVLQTRIPGRSGDVSAPLMTLFAVFAVRAFLRSTARS